MFSFVQSAGGSRRVVLAICLFKRSLFINPCTYLHS